jgi:hypothetical protein
MAYTINKNGGTISVADDTLNTETSLRLVGKDYIGYGEAIAQNSVSLLENFASETAPSNPIEGQIWWKPSEKVMYLRSGTTWLGVDAGSSIITVKDNTNADHNVFVARANGIPVSMTSSDTDFQLNTNETDYLQYFLDGGTGSVATIKTGINLNTVTASAMKFHGTATHAQYADVAEMYISDADHKAGTVIMFADDTVEGYKGEEVCATLHEKDPKMLGVVTTNPALLMNSTLEAPEGLFTVGVALLGRVPCKVTGIVSKGDRLVSSNVPGHAMSGGDDCRWTHVVGRSLENKTDEGEGIIEVIVGIK